MLSVNRRSANATGYGETKEKYGEVKIIDLGFIGILIDTVTEFF